jgi:hypothetical protein
MPAQVGDSTCTNTCSAQGVQHRKTNKRKESRLCDNQVYIEGATEGDTRKQGKAFPFGEELSSRTQRRGCGDDLGRNLRP